MKNPCINPIKTKQVYSEKNTNNVCLKIDNEKWFPINFQWIPLINLQNKL